MHLYPVRLAATGQHLFDADYPFIIREVIIGDITLTFHKTHWLSTRKLTSEEQAQFVQMLKKSNDDQTRAWGYDP